MKATVTLINPEESHVIEIDAWARLMFERNATKHGIPPLPSRDAAMRFPEVYMCVCSYYALNRRGEFTGTYDEFEARWGGIQTEPNSGDSLADPTEAGQ